VIQCLVLTAITVLGADSVSGGWCWLYLQCPVLIEFLLPDAG
jgi:hypothetical protein